MKDLNFVGMDLVEVLPTIDPAGITAYMAANVMHEFISILALQKKMEKDKDDKSRHG
jgi:agmatinase